jgi:hypothetical protein
MHHARWGSFEMRLVEAWAVFGDGDAVAQFADGLVQFRD